MKRLRNQTIVIIVSVAIVLAMSSATLSSENPSLDVYSPSSLAPFDGLEGQPAYIAVDGYVYDVSAVFADGTHAGYAAGREWTEAMGESGHGMSPLENNEPIGIYVSIELTISELAEYTGRDANPAYVAIDGLIYDVTESGRWRGGMHNGFRAGHDLTEEIAKVSPHGERVLANIPLVGVLID